MKISAEYRIRSLWENYEHAERMSLRGIYEHSERLRLSDVMAEDLDKIIETAEAHGHDNQWLKAVYERSRLYMDRSTRINFLNQKISECRKPLGILLGTAMSSLRDGWSGNLHELEWYHDYELQLTENMAESKKHLLESDLFYTEMLKSQNLMDIKISRYREFLEPIYGSKLDMRHIENLYELIAWDAVNFYILYELEKEKLPLFFPESFKDIHTFLKNSYPNHNENRALYALRFLMESQKKSGNKTGLTAADIYRYECLYKYSDHETTNGVYMDSLIEIIRNNPRYPEISQVYYRIVEVLVQMGQWEEAYRYAKNCPGGNDDRDYRNCNAVLNDFNAKYLNACSDAVVPEGMIRYKIEYRNIDKIFIRISEKEFNISDYINYRAPGYKLEADIDKLMERHYIIEKEIELEATKFHEVKKAEFDLPELTAGLYDIIISNGKDIDKSDSILTGQLLVSNIKCIARSKPNIIDGLVTDSISGMPVAGADIILYRADDDGVIRLSSTKSDTGGYFDFSSIYPAEYLIMASSGNDYTLIRKKIRVHSKPPAFPGRKKRSIIMTDRSLYKPGQTIFFKGVLFETDNDNNDFSILPHEPLIIRLNSGYREIDSHEIQTTMYGSFNGSFRIPESEETGSMNIRSAYGGSALIGIYDHKIPELYIDIEENKKVYVLNETVSLRGRVADSCNKAIADAKIEYFIFIEKPFRGRDYRKRTVKIIKKGRVLADSDGRFELEFAAACDQEEKPSSSHITFNVYITAFSSDGRKRSVSKSIDAGRRNLFTRLLVDDYIVADRNFEISLDFHNLKEQIPLKGILKINKIIVPEIIEEDSRSDQGYDPEAWEDGNPVFETEFNTCLIAPHRTQASLDAGLYRISIINENKVLKSLPVIINPNPAETRFPVKIPFYSTINRSKLKAGEQFIMTWGTGYNDGKAYIEISKDNRILRSFWTRDNETYHTERFTITEKLAGGFSAAVYFVHSNRTYTKTYIVDVPYPRWDMEAHFEKRLIAENYDLIEISIDKGINSINPAEMAATIYDISYDRFLEHTFPSLDFLIREKDSTVLYHTDEYRPMDIIKGRDSADIITRPNICCYPATFTLHPGRNNSLPGFFKEDPCILDDIEEAVYFNPCLLSDRNDLLKIYVQSEKLPAEMRLLGFIHTDKGMKRNISIDLERE